MDLFQNYKSEEDHNNSMEDYIKSLEAQNKKLREALSEIANHHGFNRDYNVKYNNLKESAREALKQIEDLEGKC